ncbi:rab9 effector protein with kelch motifs isoform X3 [Pyxicephalus adspersus]|uniref:rab9 effector protein with kelch motifs isoform X3 n=1 Tax=Pyxicephalus adspersus TaxID=30357 RepID=UPI003B58CE69
MELMGILEPDDVPKELIWYAFVPGGTAPSPRVGQTCMYLPAAEEGGKGSIAIIGGADPGCCFSDAHIINLAATKRGTTQCIPKICGVGYLPLQLQQRSSTPRIHLSQNCPYPVPMYTYKWDSPDWDGMLPRYEHASFMSTGNPGSIWVFGGAEQAKNQGSVQVLYPGSNNWKSPKVEGCIPSPRTFHTTSASIGDKLFVFGGGEKAADPVADKKLYVFDSDTMKWEEIRVKGDVPLACAAHSALLWEKCIYIFGGLTETGPVSTMHRYDTENHTWTKMKFNSPSPAARLDHSMCLFPWKINMDLSDLENELDNIPEKREINLCAANKEMKSKKCSQVTLCLIFGGMDTNGELYNDCSVTALTK